MKILITGGAGYLGSHLVKLLDHAGYDVVVFDNLATGQCIPEQSVEFHQGDLLNQKDLYLLFERHHFDAVVHCGSRAIIEESWNNPALYYRNNLSGSMNLLEQMRQAGTGKLVFASSWSVYGQAHRDKPVSEQCSACPDNPLGWSKLTIERMLHDYARSYRFDSVTLRLFNLCGADSHCSLNSRNSANTRLIPSLMRAAAEGQQEPVRINRGDAGRQDLIYLLHVTDACKAMMLALEFIRDTEGSHVFNIGSDQGHSLEEIIDRAEKTVGRAIPHEFRQTPPLDYPSPQPDIRMARQTLDWKPSANSSLERMLQTCWDWQQTLSRRQAEEQQRQERRAESSEPEENALQRDISHWYRWMIAARLVSPPDEPTERDDR
jgi:UDP-glucose 4-epimerase